MTDAPQPPGPEWNPSSAGQTPPPQGSPQGPPQGPPGSPYGQSMYGQNPYGWQPQQPQQTSVLAIVALVLGIVGILGDFLCCLGLPFGLGALITGVLALRETGEKPGATQPSKQGRGMAIGGIVTGALAFVGGIVLLVLVIAAGNGAFDWSYNTY